MVLDLVRKYSANKLLLIYSNLFHFLKKLLSFIFITPKIASLKMPELIFEVPNALSIKTMETSLSLNLNFQTLNFISI